MERLSRRQAIERLAKVRTNQAHPLADFFREITADNALVYRNLTGEPSDPRYLQQPELRLHARTYKPGLIIDVEFSETRLGSVLVPGLIFTNAGTFAAIYPLGLEPFKLAPEKWAVHTTIGNGYAVARHNDMVAEHRGLEAWFNKILSSRVFVYPR